MDPAPVRPIYAVAPRQNDLFSVSSNDSVAQDNPTAHARVLQQAPRVRCAIVSRRVQRIHCTHSTTLKALNSLIKGCDLPPVVVAVVVSHIQRIGCQPEKNYYHGVQSRSWSADHGKVVTKDVSRRRSQPLSMTCPPPPDFCLRNSQHPQAVSGGSSEAGERPGRRRTHLCQRRRQGAINEMW